MPQVIQRTKVFLCYHRNDLKALERLKVHLLPLERKGIVDCWDNTCLLAGDSREDEINKALASAKVAVLLISPDFLASEFIDKNELAPLLDAAEKEQVVLMPVIVNSCMFEEHEALARFRPINDPSIPVAGMRNRAMQDKLWLEIVRSIIAILEKPSSAPTSQILSEPPPCLRNLPLFRTRFIGHEEKMREWSALLRDPKVCLLTLSGLGGVGKSRVARELAEICADHFQGVCWIPLEQARTREDMLQRILQALGMQPQPQPSLMEQLIARLRAYHYLLVLDTTEQIPTAAEVVGELLEAVSELTCLVATRRTLELGVEHFVEVLPLSACDAQSLFLDRARAGNPDFMETPDSLADIGALCAMLEGIPLAIELVASRTVVLTPAEIRERLDRILAGPVSTMPLRHRTLSATLDWSYELLAEPEKTLLRQLSIFAGGFCLADIEAVCDMPDVWQSLLKLRRHSLLRPEANATGRQMRYRMLKAVAEYAAEKLRGDPSVETAIRQRHAKYFMSFAETQMASERTKHEVTALDALERAGDNVECALRQSGIAGEAEYCGRLALAFVWYLCRRGFWQKALEITQTALKYMANADDGSFLLLQARLRYSQAEQKFNTGDLVAALDDVTESLQTFRLCGSMPDAAQALNLMGLIANRRKLLKQAENYYQEGLRLYQALNDITGCAIILINLGEVASKANEPEVADRYYRQALAIFLQTEDQRGISDAENTLGIEAYNHQNYSAAYAHYSRALQAENSLRSPFGIARSLHNIGEVMEKQEDGLRACRYFFAALHLFTELGAVWAEYTRAALLRVGCLLSPCAEVELETLIKECLTELAD